MEIPPDIKVFTKKMAGALHKEIVEVLSLNMEFKAFYIAGRHNV